MTRVFAAAATSGAPHVEDGERDVSVLIDNALPIAGLFVLVLLGAVFLLWLSMRRQLRKIDPSLPMDSAERTQELDRRLTERAVERGERSTVDDEPTGA